MRPILWSAKILIPFSDKLYFPLPSLSLDRFQLCLEIQIFYSISLFLALLVDGKPPVVLSSYQWPS